MHDTVNSQNRNDRLSFNCHELARHICAQWTFTWVGATYMCRIFRLDYHGNWSEVIYINIPTCIYLQVGAITAQICSKTHSPNVPARADICADTCRCEHGSTRAGTCWHLGYQSYGVIKMLGSVRMCQHLESCWHVPARADPFIWRRLGYQSHAVLKMLGGVSTEKWADTYERADTRRHVLTHLGANTWRHLGYQSYGVIKMLGVLECVST